MWTYWATALVALSNITGCGSSESAAAVGGVAGASGGSSANSASGIGGLSGVTTGGATSGTVAAGGTPSSGGSSQAGGTASSGGTTLACNTSATGFVHPGLLISQRDLERARAKIAAKAEPWYGNFTTLSTSANSSATAGFSTPPPIIGRNTASAYASTRYAAEAAAVVAFQNALTYALAGDAAHAQKAVEILNAYASTTQHFDVLDPERDLEAAILGWLWVSAAELVRYSGFTGWAAADLAKFNSWIYNVVYADTSYAASGVLQTPLVNGAGARGAFGLRTKLAIGIYLDNKSVYDEAVDYFFNGQGNGAPSYYVNPTTGQTWEAGRDQAHAQGGLSRLVETAHLAYNQCDPTLYGWQNHALYRAIEYIASYNLGNDVTYSAMQPFTTSWADVYPTISATGRGSFATIYELPYSYYHDELGLAMPFAAQAIASEVTETFSAQNDNPMFATLLYRR